MSDHKPSETGSNNPKTVADRSEAAGIADEGAAYTKAIEKEETDEPEAHPS